MLPVSETRIYIMGVVYREVQWIRPNASYDLKQRLEEVLNTIPTLEWRAIRIINQHSKRFGRSSEIHIKNVMYKGNKHLDVTDTDELRLLLIDKLPLVEYLNYSDVSVLDDRALFKPSIQF